MKPWPAGPPPAAPEWVGPNTRCSCRVHLRLHPRQAQGRASTAAAAYLLHAALTTRWTFDLKDSDVFWCTADIGWVTGHPTSPTARWPPGGTGSIF